MVDDLMGDFDCCRDEDMNMTVEGDGGRCLPLHNYDVNYNF